MRKAGLTLVVVLLGVFLLAGSAMTAPFSYDVTNDVYSGVVNGIPTANDDNDNPPTFVPDINDAINQIQGTSYADNKDVDHLFVEPDYLWLGGGNGTVVLIGLTAGYSNTLGYYTDPGTGNSKTDIIGPYSGFGFLGDGTLTNPYPAAPISVSSGSLFGWYLHANQSTYYYSEPGLNPNGYDHLMTFALPDAVGEKVYVDYGNGPEEYIFNNPYLLAWEDLPWDSDTLTLGDDDHDDMIYIVDKVAPVPIPPTILLLGSGLLGFGLLSRRKKGNT